MTPADSSSDLDLQQQHPNEKPLGYQDSIDSDNCESSSINPGGDAPLTQNPSISGIPPMSRQATTTMAMEKSPTSTPTITTSINNNSNNSNTPYATGLTLYTVLSSVSLVTFLVLLDTSIITTAIPKITSEFSSLPDVGWYGSAYQLCNAALQPLTGKIYSLSSSSSSSSSLRIPIKYSFLAFFLLFELGSLLCGVATSSKMMIIGRAVSGMGGSGLMNGSLTIINSCAEPRRRPALMGIMMGLSQLGSACGPLLGGAFTEYVSWRWCFYVNLPVGAVAAGFLVLARIPDGDPGAGAARDDDDDDKNHRRDVVMGGDGSGSSGGEEKEKQSSAVDTLRMVHEKLDLVGFALFAPAAIMLLLALQYGGGGDFAWDSATVIGLFCGSAATFGVWGYWNWRRGEDALIPVGTVTRKVVWTSGITMCMLFCTLIMTSYFLPIYFQAVKGVSAMTSGVHFLPSILPQLVFSILSGFAVTKTGYTIPYALTSTVMASVACGLISTLTPGSSTGKWVGYQILGGAGRGIGFQTPLVAVQSSVQAAEMPVAMAFLIFLQFLSSSIFLTIANTIFNQALMSELRSHAPSVDPSKVIAAGATGFRDVVDSKNLAGVLRAYSDSLNSVFILGAALGAVAFFTAWGMGWVDIRKVGPKKKSSDGAATDEV